MTSNTPPQREEPPLGGKRAILVANVRDALSGDLMLPSAVMQQWDKYAPAITRWESLTRPAPAPTEPNRNSRPRLAAPFPEWMMGWPAGWVSDMVTDAHKRGPTKISRNEALHIIGSGVCPQQAATTLCFLLSIRNG